MNIHQCNLYQILNIMFQVKTNSILETLQNKVIEQNYSTRYTEYSFKEANVF